MPNDPSTLLDILAGLPDPADYDAICVAVMASERGRRFLTEYASRNRHADTQVLVGAIARVEAALRGEPSPHGSETQAGEFTDVAAAIDGIAAEIATNKAPPPDTFAALERIQDIAFVLHERPVEQTLCDALDAALRDVSDALVQSARALERTHQAAEQLQVLANRVRAMIAGSAPVAPIPSDAPVRSSAWAQPFELAADDGGHLATQSPRPHHFYPLPAPSRLEMRRALVQMRFRHRQRPRSSMIFPLWPRAKGASRPMPRADAATSCRNRRCSLREKTIRSATRIPPTAGKRRRREQAHGWRNCSE